MIAEGTVFNREKNREEAYVMRLLTPGDIPQMLAVQEFVLQQEDFEPSWFFPYDEAEFQRVISTEGSLLPGIFVEGRLIAFRVGCPGTGEYSDIPDILGPPYSRGPTYLLNGVFVDPAYRGNHLQQLMSEYTIEQCRRRKVRYFATAIHPDNMASLRSLEAIGFEIATRTRLYGGRYERCILVKELSE